MIKTFLYVYRKVFVGFPIEGKLTSYLKHFEEFVCIEARIGILCAEQFFVGVNS